MNLLEREMQYPISQQVPVSLKRKIRSTHVKENILAYVFLAPSLIFFGIFLLYPMMKSIYLSFHLTDPRGRIAAYVGWDNFHTLFVSNAFWKGLWVTGKFAFLTVPAGIVLGLIMAGLAHARLRGIRVFQFIFSLPLAVSVGTSSVIWMMLFHPTMGMFNYFLSLIHIAPVQWLTDPSWSLMSISLMTIWMNSGFNFIVLLSGLQNISEDIYDSAKIDGSGPIRTYIKLIIPLLSPTLFFLFIVSMINSLQSFGQIHILTQGGPAGSTEVLVYSIYKEAFVNYQFGTGSAISIVLFLIILLLTFVQFFVVEKRVHYQ
ncbi:sn-glycerol 3-phosphate transport system permease protein [Paenibacillus shirakamiensis]|uniref:Sn-glycerol 3-phosphate transport system permease protein n=1 Tax=Paenibacillus shirakamiensis TaxID=1265935 RepID=A0ABS4JKV9_9BACL|nr:sn-glycerol 3-phosphate transport system permease protein [Paenibacillus shirakamiensis]